MDEANISYEIHRSEYAQHEKELFDAGIAEGYRQFVLIGGDGTFHSIGNSLMHQPESIRKEVTLAMLAAGTGNDWCRTFLNSAKPKQVFEWMKAEKTYVQDVGWATYQENGKEEKRYFLNVAGMGFDAYVAKNYLSDNPGNSLIYLKGLLKGLLKFQAPKAHLSFDSEEISGTAFILAAALVAILGQE